MIAFQQHQQAIIFKQPQQLHSSHEIGMKQPSPLNLHEDVSVPPIYRFFVGHKEEKAGAHRSHSQPLFGLRLVLGSDLALLCSIEDC